MKSDQELLREYAEKRSEAAFEEVTRRHIDLVYSAALRQLEGEAHLAEEAAQSVFLDLAQKAGSLARHSSLTGWLFTTTRFTAMNIRRSELRRRARELKAEALIEADSDSAWQELRPVLDEAMHDLGARDRDALLLHFFEGNPLTVVGARCGLTESGARMRVQRALEKLRRALKKRGVLATSTGLAALLGARSVSAAAGDLPARIASRARLSPPRVTFPLWNTKAFAATVGVVLFSFFGLWLGSHSKSRGTSDGASNRGAEALLSPGTLAASAETIQDRTTTGPAPSAPRPIAAPSIRIETVRAETGVPMANVLLELLTFDGDKWKKTSASTSEEGVAILSYREGTTQFDLLTRGNGHANSRLHLRPDRGEKIPEHYTFKLTKPVWIGGTVVDPDGTPIARAKVTFGHQDTADLERTNIFHAYRYAEATTDASGRWQMERIAPEMLPLSSASANHPEYQEAPYIELVDHPEVIAALTNGTHVFRLARTVAVRGIVLNEQGGPVAGAKVSSEHHMGGSQRRETITREDGGFLLENVAPGLSYLTAEAEGYAPTTIKATIKDTDGPYELKMNRGGTVRFRVIDPEGRGIQGARLWLEPFHNNFGQRKEPEPVDFKIELTLITDGEGRAVWTNAPDALLSFAPSASGFLSGRSVWVRPSNEERVIQLQHALTIRGTVRDSSGNPIPRYRIGAGWPEKVYGMDKWVPRWSDIDRFWLTFTRPDFEHTFEEPVVLAPEHAGYFFKFEADGYVPVVTRRIEANEREVTFDITLQTAKEKRLRIVDSLGKAVPNVPVLFLPEGRIAVASGTSFQERHDDLREGRTDQEGELPMKPDPEITRVVAVCPMGTLDLELKELPPDGIVSLRPWGVVRGTVLRDKAPSAGELLILARPENYEPEPLPRPMRPLSFNVDPVRTGEDGSFVFTNAPPGDLILALVRHKLGPEGKLIQAVHERKVALEVIDGSPIEVTIDLPETELSRPIPRN